MAYRSSRESMRLERLERAVKNGERCAPFIGETLLSFTVPFVMETVPSEILPPLATLTYHPDNFTHETILSPLEINRAQ
jgi:hypothetical protein